jgi:hypothetical protein
VGNRKPPSVQINHFQGINNILVRLLEAGAEPVWYSTREATSWLYNNIKSRTVHYDGLNDRYVVQTKRSPYTINPDAMVQLPDGRSYFIEYETGSIHGAKAEGKFLGYLDLQIGANVKIPPVVFVTPKDNVEKLERARKKALSREEYQDVEFLTQFYILEEGTETSFFLNDSATEYEVVREETEETKETEQESISISVPDNDPEEIARLQRHVAELEEKLKDMDYWVEKATTLQRLVKEQQEWIEALTDRLRGQWLTRRVLEDFTKTNPIPQTKLDKEA